MTPETKLNSMIINIHDAREAHDRLHRDGYLGVRHVKTQYDSQDKPVYIFRACRHGHRYILDINRYGEVINLRNVGDCHRHHRPNRYYEREY